MKPKIGSVPFLNARPLVAWFETEGASEADVVFENPSQLGPMVDRGDIDAAIASSFFAVTDPTLRVASGVSISSFGPVRSVRLFSKMPFDQISTLALDSASMTSNHLALILLSQIYGASPRTESQGADLGAMLSAFDAAVMIGDAGMTASAAGLNVLDLGEAWTNWTGKPFVWAMWVGRTGMDDRLAHALQKAKDYGVSHLADVSKRAAEEHGIPEAAAFDYLHNAIDFDLGTKHLEGFALYGQKCAEMGFIEQFEMSTLVGGASARSISS